jgi:hypothetical protein
MSPSSGCAALTEGLGMGWREHDDIGGRGRNAEPAGGAGMALVVRVIYILKRKRRRKGGLGSN